jgi:hypothetical protein
MLLAILAVLSLSPAAASAQCRHFCKGGMDLGLGFGGGSTDGEFFFSLAGNAGYFIADGLVVGGSVVYQSKPEYVLPEAYSRYYLPFDWSITPFVIGKIGRLYGLEDGWPDATIASGGAGIASFLSKNVAFQVWVIYQSVFHDAYADGWDFGGGLGFYL